MGAGLSGIAGHPCADVRAPVKVEPCDGAIVVFLVEGQATAGSSVNGIAVQYWGRGGSRIVGAGDSRRAAGNASVITTNIIT